VLNAGLLRVLVATDSAGEAPAFGLPPTIVTQLRRLAPRELEFIAGTPVLLAVFEPPPFAVGQIADAESGCGRYAAPVAGPQPRQAELFAAALVTWLWQMDRHDELVRALCVEAGQPLPAAGFPTIDALAGHAARNLRARFCDHPRFWPDLLRAARSRDADLRELVRLSALPLLVAEARQA
jgi:hypothetical protein